MAAYSGCVESRDSERVCCSGILVVSFSWIFKDPRPSCDTFILPGTCGETVRVVVYARAHARSQGEVGRFDEPGCFAVPTIKLRTPIQVQVVPVLITLLVLGL